MLPPPMYPHTCNIAMEITMFNTEIYLTKSGFLQAIDDQRGNCYRVCRGGVKPKLFSLMGS